LQPSWLVSESVSVCMSARLACSSGGGSTREDEAEVKQTNEFSRRPTAIATVRGGKLESINRSVGAGVHYMWADPPRTPWPPFCLTPRLAGRRPWLARRPDHRTSNRKRLGGGGNSNGSSGRARVFTTSSTRRDHRPSCGVSAELGRLNQFEGRSYL
jgi:hypothetical protein